MARPELGATTTPVTQAFGDVASAGSSGANAARGDHRHGMPAVAPEPETVTLLTGAAGLSSYVARAKLAADTQHRIQLGFDNTDRPGLQFGPGGAGARETLLVRDATRSLSLLGGLGASPGNVRFTVQEETWPANCIVTWVYGDSQPRVSLGLDASGFGRLTIGPGGSTAPDILMTRDSAGSVRFSSGGAAASSSITVESTAGQSSFIGAMVAGDTSWRTMVRGDATGSAIWFGSGAAGADVVLSRTAANELSLASGDSFNIVGGGASYKTAGTQVVGSRKTGWGAPTGTATRTAFATASVTLPNLAAAVKALIDDLTLHGLIGA
jgi:hypothetical protein